MCYEENSLRISYFSRAVRVYDIMICCEQHTQLLREGSQTTLSDEGQYRQTGMHYILICTLQKIYIRMHPSSGFFCCMRRHAFHKIYCSGKYYYKEPRGNGTSKVQ